MEELGALQGITYMGTQNGSKLEFWWWKLLIHASEFKLRCIEVYICIGKPYTYICNDLHLHCNILQCLYREAIIAQLLCYAMLCRGACCNCIVGDYARACWFWDIFSALLHTNYTLSRKNNLIHGGYESTWGYNFIWTCGVDKARLDSADCWLAPLN